MKIILSVLMGLIVSQAAQAAPKAISERMLNTVMKNHLWVAKVKHPGFGLKLFDTCVDGDVFKSISNTPASRCVEYSVEVDPETIHNSTPIETKICNKWERFNPKSNVKRIVQKQVNCRWVQGRNHPNQAIFGDRPSEYFTVCDNKGVVEGFPLTQVIEVHQLHDNFGDNVYYHMSHEDRAVAGYQRFSYTIPACNR